MHKGPLSPRFHFLLILWKDYWWIKSNFEDWSSFQAKDRTNENKRKNRRRNIRIKKIHYWPFSYTTHFRHQYQKAVLFYANEKKWPAIVKLYSLLDEICLKKNRPLIRHHFIRNLFRRIGFLFICFVGSQILLRGNNPEKTEYGCNCWAILRIQSQLRLSRLKVNGLSEESYVL